MTVLKARPMCLRGLATALTLEEELPYVEAKDGVFVSDVIETQLQ